MEQKSGILHLFNLWGINFHTVAVLALMFHLWFKLLSALCDMSCLYPLHFCLICHNHTMHAKGLLLCKIIYSCYRQRLVELCQRKSKEHNGWIFTWGYHFLFHGDMNRTIIDQICPDQPLVVWHRSFHCLHLNSKGIIH